MRLTAAFVLSVAVALPLAADAQTRTDHWTACRDAGQPKLAIEGCTALIDSRAEQPKDQAFALISRGIARAAVGQFAEALDDYDAAQKLTPDDAVIFYNRALAYAGRGAYAPSVADFAEAVRLAPNDARPVKARGQVLFYLGRFRNAVPDLARAAELDRSDAYTALWHHIALARDQRARESRLAADRAALDATRWPAPVVGFFLREMKPEDLVAAARHPDPQTEREQLCEAFFYIGQAAMIDEDVSAAMQLFRMTIDTGVTNFIEYRAARAEMTRLAQ